MFYEGREGDDGALESKLSRWGPGHIRLAIGERIYPSYVNRQHRITRRFLDELPRGN